MSEFFSMGGYGAYVWSAYAVFAMVLLSDALIPIWQRRNTLRDLGARLRREAARNVSKNIRSSAAVESSP